MGFTTTSRRPAAVIALHRTTMVTAPPSASIAAHLLIFINTYWSTLPPQLQHSSSTNHQTSRHCWSPPHHARTLATINRASIIWCTRNNLTAAMTTTSQRSMIAVHRFRTSQHIMTTRKCSHQSISHLLFQEPPVRRGCHRWSWRAYHSRNCLRWHQ